jgi:hypothetical protein
MQRWHLGLAAVLLLLVGALWLLRAVENQRPRGTDAQQITALVASGARAAQARDPDALRRLVSNEYRDENGFRADAVRLQIGRVLGQAQQVRAYVPANSIVVQLEPDGQHATASFQIQFEANTRNGDLRFDGPINLRLAREPVRYFLVFPGHEWRIVSAGGYDSTLGWFN